MSVIVGLKEKEYVMENIGEFGLFMMERNGIPILELDENTRQRYSTNWKESLKNMTGTR